MTNITPDYMLESQKNYNGRKTRAYTILKQMAVRAGYSEGTEGFDTFCDDWDAGKIKPAMKGAGR